MKIRAIELSNLRRFAGQRARIDGIGDGISVLCEPNEFGKSTFFDGLHALFFQQYRSKGALVKALQPHAGGAPEVAVEVDLPQGRFRLEKRWLTRQTARVLDASGRLIAQEDEAEAWIDQLTGQGLAGPSGLLWVRQGLLGLEPEGSTAADKTDRERALSARRDLLSSFETELEVMTGGRRMDQVQARLSEALGRLATTTGRPKAGGDWARAVEEATELRARREGLEEKAGRLTEALARRARLLRDLQHLRDPEITARDEKALAEAETAFQAAERHAGLTRDAESRLRLAQLTAAHGQNTLAQLQELQQRQTATQQAQAETRARADQAEVEAATLLQAEETAREAQEAAEQHLQALGQRQDQARRAQLRRSVLERLTALSAQIERAARQRELLEEHQAARAALQITPALLARAEAAQSQLDRLTLQAEARLVSVQLHYSGDLRVRQAGLPVEAPLRLRGVTRLELPGIGEMTVDPGLAASEDADLARDRAAADLAKALAACQLADLPAARAALAEVQRLEAASAQGQALLKEMAPAGLEALRAEAARLRQEAGDLPEVAPEDPALLQAAFEQAQTAALAALQNRTAASARAGTAREVRAAALAAAGAADQAQRDLAPQIGDPQTLAARLLSLSAEQPALVLAEAQAAEALAQLRRDAPDLATAQAAVTRLRSVRDGRLADRARFEADLAGANGSIGALADEGIEEALSETRDREATAQARATRYAREVQALELLRKTLEDARRAAREVYFGPVLAELGPLLSILHPGAALRIDDTSLLPVALMREGQDEGLDILSGGTREQLAVLTRLAFARLFARSGRPVPVILDDALVHSDDDRIEAMFTALHRVAQDQQILVLTCRQRAFGSLGGTRLQARVEAL